MSNLLPPQEKKAILRMYRQRFLSVALVALAGIAIASSFLVLPTFFLVETKESLLEEKRAILAGRETSEIQRTLAQSIGDINERLGVFPSTAPSSPIIGSFIDPVLSAKTARVHLVEFSYSVIEKKPGEIQIEIAGVADNRSALLEFAERLRKAENISNVTVPIESFIKDQNVTFRATAILSLK